MPEQSDITCDANVTPISDDDVSACGNRASVEALWTDGRWHPRCEGHVDGFPPDRLRGLFSGAPFKHALLSDDQLYRYALWRVWGPHTCLRFVMLNPSTADATLDDPTIRRCVGFARREGYDGLVVLNLYAYRATDPRALLACADAVGPLNNLHLTTHLAAAALAGEPVVAAWGANAHPRRAREVLDLTEHRVDWRCLGTTKDGHPRHPLYVKGDQPLVPFVAR